MLVGDDIIKFDSCGPRRDEPYPDGTIIVSMILNGELTPGTQVLSYNNGLGYKVSVFQTFWHSAAPSPCTQTQFDSDFGID